MEKVAIDVTVRLELEAEEKQLLERILGKTLTLQDISSAAVEEYVRMILGQRTFTRGSDLSEYRLFLLLKHAFASSVPPEAVVCRLFQLTPARARSLVRNVLAKYQYDLRNAIDTSLQKVLSPEGKPEFSGNYIVVKVDSDALVGLLRDRIREWDLEEQIRPHTGPNEFLILPNVQKRLLAKLQNG
jgi:hypothetical protein